MIHKGTEESVPFFLLKVLIFPQNYGIFMEFLGVDFQKRSKSGICGYGKQYGVAISR